MAGNDGILLELGSMHAYCIFLARASGALGPQCLHRHLDSSNMNASVLLLGDSLFLRLPDADLDSNGFESLHLERDMDNLQSAQIYYVRPKQGIQGPGRFYSVHRREERSITYT